MSGVPSLVSMLLVVLLGASPLVGPVCALLCGHSAGSVDGERERGHAHATHGHEPHQHPAHAPEQPEPGVATAGIDDDSRLALSSGASCCAFDVGSSTVAAAPRMPSQVTASPIDAEPTRLIAIGGSDPRTLRSAPLQPRPAWSSAHPPFVLRI